MGAYAALPCGGGPMTDPAGDTPNAAGPLDVVGTAALPAGFHAADGQFLYLRMRVAGSPVQGGALQADAWGWEFDLDGDRSTYELLVSVSGIAKPDTVAVYRHPTTNVVDSPADPAETPPAFSYPFSSHARVVAAGSTLGGGGDTFVDVAVPWSDLATLGLRRDTPVHVWEGTSTTANALDLDLACFGGAGGTLSGIDVGQVTADPNPPPGGGGGGTGPRTLEGGPGCAIAGHPPAAPFWLVLVALALVAWRLRRAA